MIEYLGLWILITLTVNMWALVSVVRTKTPLWRRALWIPVLLVPIFGFILWYMLGPRRSLA